jgi:hypothetical protein
MPSHRLPRQLTKTAPRWKGRPPGLANPATPRSEVNGPDELSLDFPRFGPGVAEGQRGVTVTPSPSECLGFNSREAAEVAALFVLT